MTDTIERREAVDRGEWKPTACILCECNCGIEVRLGGDDGRRFERDPRRQGAPGVAGLHVREGAAARPLPERPRDRVAHPLRRRADGTFEEIDWDTAIREVAARLRRGARRARRRVDLLLRRRRAGQPPRRRVRARHAAARSAPRYRSSALAQEKTGEFWVNGRMVGALVARRLRALRGRAVPRQEPVDVAQHPARPHDAEGDRQRPGAGDDRHRPAAHRDRRARRHPPPGASPGRDAWLLGGDGRRSSSRRASLDRAWLAEHARPASTTSRRHWRAIADRRVVRDQRRAPRTLVRAAARRLAAAASVAVFEDLGVQMNRHSTLVSYLEKLRLAAHRQLRQAGRAVLADVARRLVRTSREERDAATGRARPSPARASSAGSIPCNVIPEEILTDHPKRFRAMLVESGNPAHSLADSARMREAIERARPRRRDRRRDDRDRAARRLRAAGAHPVREGRGDVLQLRVPAQRLPPAPPGRRAARRPAARGGDPRPPRRGRGALPDDADLAPLAGRGRRQPGRRSPPRSCGDARATRRSARWRRSCSTARSATLPDGAAARRGAVGRSPSAARCATPTACAGPASATAPRPATGSSTRSSPARRASCSRRRLGRDVAAGRDAATGASSSRSPSCSTSSPRWPTRCRPATTPSGRSCCRPASGARSPPTRSSATRRGGRGTPRARCAWRPPTRPRSASPTAAAARLTTQARRRPSSRSPSTTACSPATSRCRTASASTTSTATAAVVTGVAPNELTAGEDRDPWAGTPWHKSVAGADRPHPRAQRTQWLSHGSSRASVEVHRTDADASGARDACGDGSR